jgi:uncharacterized membrane protein YbaN (DUF454 family)
MSIASFGMYHLLWHYQNWKRYRARSTRAFSVVVRTILGPIFVFRLFERLRHDLRETALPGMPEPGVLALLYLSCNALITLPEPWWTLAALNTVPLAIAQAGVNRLNREVAPLAPRNDRYSSWNVLLIVVGLLLVALTLLGLFVQVPEPSIPDAVPVNGPSASGRV